MHLRELNLIGFGKFKDKNIQLREGINLIYGENEAGKSTIHSFIDGMFYGFLRPDARNVRYSDEHEKYNPWDNSRYAGVINFRYKDKDYRIEREFTKEKEYTKVIDDNTGVDITNNIDTGNIRILQPGIHFFGFNTRIFSNTISIKQLNSKTDDKLADEVTEKLINVSTSLDDNISVDKAIIELKDAMLDIGTDRAHTKPYARNLRELESLENEKKEILSKKERYNAYLDEEERLKDLLSIDEEKLSNTRNKLLQVKLLKRVKKLQESEILVDEIKRLETLLEEGNKYSLNEKLDDITKDYNYFEELEDEKNSILYNKRDNSLEFIKRDYEDKNFKLSKCNKIKLLSIILTIISLGIVVITYISNKNILGMILVLIFGLMGRFHTKKINILRTDMIKLENEIESIESTEYEKKYRLKSIESLQKSLLYKYNLSTKYEFKNLALNIKTEYENSLKNLQYKRELLDKVLGEDTLDSLKNEVNNSNIILNMNAMNQDENQLRYEIDRYNQDITDYKIAIRGVEENLNILDKDFGRLVEIEEEILRKTALKEELELNYNSLQLALDTINELSKDIHSQFAPMINRKVGKVMDKITNGKYTNIRVSESLDIKVENPNTGEIVHLNSLSGGTIDQLYFSLRFGIINSMVEENLPLILDDCFIQYDDKRLSNIIEFLYKISEDRQIILFTCQDREERILKSLDINYNSILLT